MLYDTKTQLQQTASTLQVTKASLDRTESTLKQTKESVLRNLREIKVTGLHLDDTIKRFGFIVSSYF